MKWIKQRQTRFVPIGTDLLTNILQKENVKVSTKKELLENLKFLSKNNLKIYHHITTQIRDGNVKGTIEPAL